MDKAHSNCCCCGKIFTPNPKLGKRQKTCGRKACKKELNRQNQTQWRTRNSDYHKGRYPYLKTWLIKQPGYLKQWRKKRRDIQNSISPPSPLKSIRCLIPVNLLKSDIQNSILTLTPLDKETYKAWWET